MERNPAVLLIIVFFCVAMANNKSAKTISANTSCKSDTLKKSPEILNETKSIPDLKNYSLFIHEEFPGEKLNTKTWSYYRKGDVVNNLVYTADNAHVQNGKVYLTANKLSNEMFSGVDINTKAFFKYGYFEVKAKLPKAIGIEAAFWFFPWSMPETYAGFTPSIDGVEIDVFEYSPAIFETMIYSLHWNGYDYAKGAQVSSKQEYLPGISNGYHTFALEWTPEEYVVYIDGNERIRTDKIISRKASTLILGFGTGGFGGTNYAGPWPDTFAIDYVKIYKRNPEVRMYGDSNGNGWISGGLQPGNYTTAQLKQKGIIDNEASSLEVPKGWKVIAYTENNFKGDAVSFATDTGIIGNDFNDKISSIKITVN